MTEEEKQLLMEGVIEIFFDGESWCIKVRQGPNGERIKHFTTWPLDLSFFKKALLGVLDSYLEILSRP